MRSDGFDPPVATMTPRKNPEAAKAPTSGGVASGMLRRTPRLSRMTRPAIVWSGTDSTLAAASMRTVRTTGRGGRAPPALKARSTYAPRGRTSSARPAMSVAYQEKVRRAPRDVATARMQRKKGMGLKRDRNATRRPEQTSTSW